MAGERDPEGELSMLRALVDGLLQRLPPLSKRQADDVGMYLLRAVWLGRGVPVEKVLAPVTYDDERPALTVVRKD